jgi:hypothetical protein
MLAAYAKNEKENITPAQKAAYRRLIQAFEAGMTARQRQ